YEKTAIILIIRIAAQKAAPRLLKRTKVSMGTKFLVNTNLRIVWAWPEVSLRSSNKAELPWRTTQKFILLLAAIWKIDEGSSTTKPKRFAYNGCFRQFAKKSPLVVATLTPSAR